ncbi:ADP-ribosylglycohydrolase family protein [Sporosarcina sp. HYO08]|uniref:ADP-ribosylglycohydrolase family protein n=1 Tax=Sporosarcina sp. HYO08 TaxID=1759557 RepID=UPI0007944CCF|nr:ADP-ribosylglycohydrolase family protein [Sporosarcina sp. HYO08]KXH87009.1 hypothetical protein AU377_00040 [Sporosarcina sp. HYO08]
MVKNKVIGSLVGVALGDAMGMPSQLWPRERVKAHFGKIDGFLPGPDEHHIVKGFKAGTFTDDTGQALKICESLIQNDGVVKPEAIAYAILDWVEEQHLFDKNSILGPSSKVALMKIKNGTPVTEAGGAGDTNGAAMRIAPIGMISKSDDIKRLVDHVEQASLATHNTNIAIAGAAMLAGALSAAIDGDDWDGILEKAYLAYDEGFTRGNIIYGPSSKERLKLALKWIEEEKDEEKLMDQLYYVLGSGVHTTESVPVAIALAYYAKGDAVKASILAANLGGDCDTVGAMTGGLCGAYSGIEGIPSEYVQILEEVNGVNLTTIATKLFAYRQ